MSTHLLTRRSYRPRTDLPLIGDLGLKRGRLHECCGTARHVFALMLAPHTDGPVFWITPRWGVDHLNPNGVAPMLDPSRLILTTPDRPEDLLWTMEEVLRSGTAALAIADIPGLPGLTPVRRLHLAAETGGTQTKTLPTGLILTPGHGGAQGVESRWQMDPQFTPNGQAWALRRLRARSEPVADWHIQGDHGQFTVIKDRPHQPKST